MPERLTIDLFNLPEEGKNFSGELPAEIFDLSEHDPQPVGPLVYDLYVQRFESANISLEIEQEGVIDATEALREEILLEIPDYPRCDEADEPMHCEIDPRYLAVDKPVGDTVETRPRAAGDDRWSALDALDNLDSER